LNLNDGSEPERIHSALVTADFFPALGVDPTLGRALIPDEIEQGNNHVAVVSYNLWQRRFGGDPSLVGNTISLNQESYVVVGIISPVLQHPKDGCLGTHLVFGDESLRPEDKSPGSGLQVIARLKPGVTMEHAQAEMSLIARDLEKQNPETNNGRGVKLIALRVSRFQESKTLQLRLRQPAK